jgi:hypothetical protein
MVDTMLTTLEAAALLQRTPRQILNLIERGLLSGSRLGPSTRGGRWMVTGESVEELKERWAVEPPKPGRKKGQRR